MTAKISITMPERIEATSRAAAEYAGKPLSTWIAEACEREAYRQGMAHDAAVIAEHDVLGNDWAMRQAAAIAAMRNAA